MLTFPGSAVYVFAHADIFVDADFLDGALEREFRGQTFFVENGAGELFVLLQAAAENLGDAFFVRGLGYVGPESGTGKGGKSAGDQACGGFCERSLGQRRLS